MDHKKEFQNIVKSLKAKALLAGKTLTNAEIASKLKYNVDYFNTLTGKSGKVTEDHLNTLKLTFHSELNDIQKPSSPGDPDNRERALVKNLLFEAATSKVELSEMKAEISQLRSMISDLKGEKIDVSHPEKISFEEALELIRKNTNQVRQDLELGF